MIIICNGDIVKIKYVVKGKTIVRCNSDNSFSFSYQKHDVIIGNVNKIYLVDAADCMWRIDYCPKFYPSLQWVFISNDFVNRRIKSATFLYHGSMPE